MYLLIDGGADVASITAKSLSLTPSASSLSGGTAATSGYTDLGSESSWAANAVKFSLENGLITGTGEGLIAPHGKITRAEAATVILRMMEKTKLYDVRTKN